MYIPLNEEPFVSQCNKSLELAMTVEEISGTHIEMTLVGRLDFKTQDVFRRSFLEILEKNENHSLEVFLHLKDCRYIDSAGFGTLLYLHRQLENKKGMLVLTKLNDELKRLFVENQLISIFHIK